MLWYSLLVLVKRGGLKLDTVNAIHAVYEENENEDESNLDMC
jgi:hypothetical protein